MARPKAVNRTVRFVTPAEIAPSPPADRFVELYDVVEEWFYGPDHQALRVLLGTMKAHYLSVGDPAWLFLVAPPGTGKTTVGIMGAAGLPEVVPLGGFTACTFLSGFYGRKEPGLLEKLGQTTQDRRTFTTIGNAILLAKDFTTVLAMRRETRSEVLGQLREIHDGEYKRSFGTGETKIWRGRVTIIAAVTPIIDRYYSIFSVLGERFLQLRWHRPDSPEAGQRAIQQKGSEDVIRRELRTAIENLFRGSVDSIPKLSSRAERRLASLAELVAIARTHVIRSNYGSREIEYVPEAEANTRISKGLAAIARGIAALSGKKSVTEQDLQDAFASRSTAFRTLDARFCCRLCKAAPSITLASLEPSPFVKLKTFRHWDLSQATGRIVLRMLRPDFRKRRTLWWRACLS